MASFNTMSNYASNRDSFLGLSESQPKRPDPAPSSQAGTPDNRAQVPRRKPVGSGSNQTQMSQRPPTSKEASIPPRRPVGGTRTGSSANSRTHSPRPSKLPNLDKPLPRRPEDAPMPAIHRDQAGAFDNLRRTAGDKVPQSPIGRTERHEIPAAARALLQSSTTQSSTVSSPAVSRPSSSGGRSFKSRKSMNEKGAESRRGSFTDAAKNAGKWVSSTAGIMAMNATDREKYRKASLSDKAKKLEHKRNLDPTTRPLHEKRYLSGLDKTDSRQFSEATFDAKVQDRAARERRSERLSEQHAKDCKEASRKGKKRPDTPDGVKLSPRKGSLTSLERKEALKCARIEDPDYEQVQLTDAERIVLNLSKKFDIFKREQKRKGSDSSDMDFADWAPPEHQFQCGKCTRQCSTYLKEGLCEDCYLYYKNTDSRKPSLTTRKKGHNPKSPEDDAQGGDLYIRLPAQHRLRKVRGTVYIDPGNPFDDGTFQAAPFLPSTTYGQYIYGDTDNSDTRNPEIMQSFGRSQKDMTSMFSDPFDLVNLRDTSPSNRETLSSFQSTRRSMSVDIGFLPTQGTTEQTDLSITEPTWPDHTPILHIPHPSGTMFTMNSKRDTQFYEFYDDLLAEYGIEKSIDATNYTQHMLPVEL